ncbi:1325_t:CDS:10 [Ambispora gerdemannii]|uniref:1325_t:CDS:1 n=1 Tax=Ambispora gerdemannii TaxID=144530 RepID=A0A9N8VS27_9GLOM|nr:1325_t:CDS:10 [Ambispora gerdemannii]
MFTESYTSKQKTHSNMFSQISENGARAKSTREPSFFASDPIPTTSAQGSSPEPGQGSIIQHVTFANQDTFFPVESSFSVIEDDSRFFEQPTPTPGPFRSANASHDMGSQETPVKFKFGDVSVVYLSLIPYQIRDKLPQIINKSACNAVLNSNNKTATLITRAKCFAWIYKHDDRDEKIFKPFMPPTLRDEFPLPIDNNSQHQQPANQPSLPFLCIVPPARNVISAGLIACSPKGQIRYWRNVFNIAEDLNHYQSLQLPVQANDYGVYLKLHEFGESKDSSSNQNVIIFGTNKSTLFQIFIHNNDAFSDTLSYSVLSRPSIFFFGNGIQYDTTTIVASALAKQSDYIHSDSLYILTQNAIEEWTLGDVKRPLKYVGGEDIISMILERLPEYDQGLQDRNRLVILDMDINRNSELLLLVAFIKDPLEWHYYLVLMMKIDNSTYQINEANLLKIPESMIPSDDAHLIIPQGGLAVFVVLPDAVIFATKSKNNKIIGFGTKESKSWISEQMDDICKLDIITTKTGIMSCQVSIADIQEFAEATPKSEDEQELKAQETANLKKKIDDCVTFSPFVIYLSHDYAGDLEAVAIEISQEILESRSNHITDTLILNKHLNYRLNRAMHLIKFIKACGFYHKVWAFILIETALSEDTRHRLFSDSEKLACAKRMWELHEHRLQKQESGLLHVNFLNEAIKEYFRHREFTANEDINRIFYKDYVKDIGEIFLILHKLVEQELEEYHDETEVKLIEEANNIALYTMQGIFEFRKDLGLEYQLKERDNRYSFTTQEQIIEVFHFLFDKTISLVEHYDMAGLTPLKSQAVKLANILFGMSTDRFILQDFSQLEIGYRDMNKSINEQIYRKRWLEILQSLAKIEKKEDAFQTADTYKDFHSLAVLCVECETNPENRDAYIRKYINIHGEQFANELYNYYLQKKHAKENKDLLHKYLHERNISKLAWLHAIGMENYREVAEQAARAASVEDKIEKKNVLLSIAKLAMLEAADEDAEQFVDEVDSGLWYNKGQESIYEKYITEIGTAGTYRDNLETQAKSILQKFAPSLSEETPTFAKVFLHLVKQVLSKRILKPYDLVDLLTLPDIVETEHFVQAIQIVEHDIKSRFSVDSTYKLVIGTIWRRIYLHDGKHWKTLTNTNSLSDYEIMEQLRQTATYKTIESLIHFNDDVDWHDYFCPLRDAMFPCSTPNLSKRFPDADEEFLSSLLIDYDHENKSLQDYLETTRIDNNVSELLRLLESNTEAKKPKKSTKNESTKVAKASSRKALKEITNQLSEKEEEEEEKLDVWSAEQKQRLFDALSAKPVPVKVVSKPLDEVLEGLRSQNAVTHPIFFKERSEKNSDTIPTIDIIGDPLPQNTEQKNINLQLEPSAKEESLSNKDKYTDFKPLKLKTRQKSRLLKNLNTEKQAASALEETNTIINQEKNNPSPSPKSAKSLSGSKPRHQLVTIQKPNGQTIHSGSSRNFSNSQLQDPKLLFSDWTIKESIIITSSKPFPMGNLFQSDDEIFLDEMEKSNDNIPAESESSLEKHESRRLKFRKSLKHWIYPPSQFEDGQIKALESLFCKPNFPYLKPNTVNYTAEMKLLKYYREMEKNWKKTFILLYRSFNNGEIPYFYYNNSSFTALFLSPECCCSTEDQKQFEGILNSSSKALRDELTSKSISFKMPLYNEEYDEYFDQVGTLDENDQDHKTERKRKRRDVGGEHESLLIIDGIKSVHALFKYLLEWKEPAYYNRAKGFPTLLASHAFRHADEKEATAVNKGAVSYNNSEKYTVELKGLLLPSQQTYLRQVMTDIHGLDIDWHSKSLSISQNLEKLERKFLTFS